jgi:hypothetical protein
MSWDLFAQNFPPVNSVDDIPEDFEPVPLGPRGMVIAKIQAAMPDADFSDPSWGLLERDGWSIEFNLGEDEECEDFALHVRGGGPGAMEAVDIVLRAAGVRAIDAQTSEFFSLEAARESFAAWQAYRDKAVWHEKTPAFPEEQPSIEAHPPRRGFFARLFGR